MFGYVLPRKDKLSSEGWEEYRAAYCGLCAALKQEYGFKARFLVNYDMTFLYFLLQQGARKQFVSCSCPTRPFCKKNCMPRDGIMDYCADLTVLLSCSKLNDTAADGGCFSRWGAKAGLRFYRGCYRKAAQRQPEAEKGFLLQLERLRQLELSCCASIDRAADAFACLLRGCARYCQQEADRRALELLLYHVGRYLYLVDALEDLPKDVRKDRYNPLRYRYSLSDGKLTEEDRQQLLSSIDASISMAASAYELLGRHGDSEVTENIIYYGLPAVMHSVADGSFRKRGKAK